jgi:hypothetical protein
MSGSTTRLQSVARSIAGETWAVVYAYESPRRPRGLWYDRWRFDVVNDYVEAASFLGTEPYVVDVDTFVACAGLRNREFDFIVNLNSGATPISNLGLVPSLAEWHNIACFPNSADVILAGERKDICKRVFAAWFQVPKDLTSAEAGSSGTPKIVKPTTMGNSQLVTRSTGPQFTDGDTIIEDFIQGYDVTIPVFFDSDRGDYIVAPPIVYLPDVSDPSNWFLSYEEKMNRHIVIERQVRALSSELRDGLLAASRAFRFQSIARFDFRWRIDDPSAPVIDLGSMWFLEINCLPTLRSDVNFLKSLKAYLQVNPLASESALPSRGTTDDIRALAFLLLQARARTLMTK